MEAIAGRIVCRTCLNKELGMRTLVNSMTRMETLKDVYQKMIRAKKVPTIGEEHLETLIPEVLRKLDMAVAYKEVEDHTSSLSTRERAFVVGYHDILELRVEAVEVAKKEQDRIDKEIRDIEYGDSDV